MVGLFGLHRLGPISPLCLAFGRVSLQGTSSHLVGIQLMPENGLAKTSTKG
jgi:hypothetical protein